MSVGGTGAVERHSGRPSIPLRGDRWLVYKSHRVVIPSRTDG